MSRNRSSRLFIPVALRISRLPSRQHARIYGADNANEFATGARLWRATPRLEVPIDRRLFDGGEPGKHVSEKSVQRAQHPGIGLFDVIVSDQADAD